VFIVILTLFPEALEPYLAASILGIARSKGLVDFQTVDFRDFSRDRHRTVDDRPFGGGPGMVLKPEPILDCVEWLERRHGTFHKVLLCPSGRPFTQPHAQRLHGERRLLLLCGRYEGFDERIRQELEWDEISIGDYVLAGGELPALVVTEAVVRLVPGVLGDERSALEESFAEPSSKLPRAPARPQATANPQELPSAASSLLDHPHYTRPRLFRGRAVPEVLLGGDHAAIARWRQQRALERTRARRPDLLA
jgi:tRNA (guanine37-N1)-methyltransferase